MDREKIREIISASAFELTPDAKIDAILILHDSEVEHLIIDREKLKGVIVEKNMRIEELEQI